MSVFGGELEGHIASLRRYAMALLRDRTDAEELVQDALTRAVARADAFQAGTNLRAWLFTILHNVHVNRIRARAARPREASLEGLEARLVVPARQEARVEAREMLEALDRLPAEQRETLLLVALEGLTYQEAAAALGCPVGTVMSRLSRAREAVRALVGEETRDRRRPGKGQGGIALRRVK